jgi:hypothetical protein
MPEHALLTTAEAAERLGITRQAVIARVHAETLAPAFKNPGPRGGYLFDPADVDGDDE